MSAPSVPRPLVGLAAAALAAGLFAVPVMAYADPTATATPDVNAASTPTPSAEQSSESATPSARSSEAAESDGASSGPSTPESGTAATSPTPDAETTTAGRARSDAAQALAPAAPTPTTPTPSERVQAQAAGITLTKSPSLRSVSRVGQVITYTFVAANTGTVALENVAITDELEGLSALNCDQTGDVTLVPDTALTCTATLTVTQEWLDFGDIYNSATVFGSYTIEGQSYDEGDNASAHVPVDQRPSIDLDASVSPTGTADSGDRLRYRATATNTGNVTLRGARITSSLDGLDLDCDPSARATLSPGESISCSGSYQVTNANARRGRVTNELTARATGPYDDQAVSDDVTLRTKVTKPPSSSDPGLADTGGPGGVLPVGVLGAAAIVVGAGLLRRGLRP